MTTSDIRQDSYNKLTQLPLLSYNIVSYLLANNDDAWKLLFYNDPNCWKSDLAHPNLTSAQKGALVYDGIKPITECRVFLDTGMDDVWNEEACQLRVAILEFSPTNYVYGYAVVGLETYCHYKINTLSNYQTRIETLLQSVVSTLNGADVSGLGRLYFDAHVNSRSRMSTIGQPPYKGKLTVMCNWIV
jgi:hypothetical protein